MQDESKMETLYFLGEFKDKVEKCETQVDKMDELHEKVCGEDEISLEKMRKIREKIGKQEEAKSEEELVTMNKIFAEDNFLSLLQNASEIEFEAYKERFQSEINATMLQHMQEDDVSEKIKRLRNRFILLETVKNYRGITV